MLGFIVMSCVLARLFLAAMTPTFYAPDEEAHYRYIEYLAETRAFPVQTVQCAPHVEGQEFYQPPLYYLLMVPVYHLARTELALGEAETVCAIRMGSIALWLVFVATVLLSTRILPASDSRAPMIAASFVCCLPTFAVVNSSVNNDNLVCCLGGLALWCSARRWPDMSLGAAAVLGVICGLGLLAKSSGVVLIVGIAAATTVALMRGRLSSRQAITRALCICLCAWLVAAPWLLRNYLVYGSLTAVDAGNAQVNQSFSLGSVVSMLRKFWGSYWAVAGIYNNITYPSLTLAGTLLTVGALIGLRRGVQAPSGDLRVIVNSRMGSWFLGWGVAVATNLLLVIWFWTIYGRAQGRFMFPALGATSLWLAVSLAQGVPSRWLSRGMGWIMAVLIVCVLASFVASSVVRMHAV